MGLARRCTGRPLLASTPVTEMSLKAFHLLFIALSVVLTAFFGAWAIGQYQSAHEVGYAVTGIVSLASGVGLALYGAAFQRKTRNL
jgi:thiol:disulfide interchange protein